MGIFDSLKSLARPYDENDMYLDEEEYQEDFPEAPAQNATQTAPPPRATATPRQENTAYSAPAAAGSSFAARDSRSMGMGSSAALQVVIVKPERFEAAAEIADHLRERRTVVINLETTQKEIARRLIDFLSGVAYAQDGKIKKVAVGTYIITPYNVGLMGDLIDELENSGLNL